MELTRRHWLLGLTLAGCGAPRLVERAEPAEGEPRRHAAPTPAPAPPAPERSATAHVLPPSHTPEALPLFRRFPALRQALPHHRIGDWPTPVLALPSLGTTKASFAVKRDDLSARPYGGGKPRKLEWFFGEALARGHEGVITFGGVGSHHIAATALYAKRAGLACHLMVLPQPPTPEVRRVLLTCAAAGATLQMVGSFQTAMARARRRRDHLTIPPGGTSALGNVGFVNAGLELADQVERGELPAPDTIVMAMGTMGSAVGLSIGLALADLPTNVVAVRASSWAAASPRKMEREFAQTMLWLRARDPSVPKQQLSSRVRIEGRYVGRGYAQPTRAGGEATRIAAEHGLRLDDTYTAKAFAALLASPWKASARVLFWHTHSARALEPQVGPSALPSEFRGFVTTRRSPR